MADDIVTTSYADVASALVAEPEGAEQPETGTESEVAERQPEPAGESESETGEQEQEPGKPESGKSGLDKRFRKLTSEIHALRAQLAAREGTGVVSPAAADEGRIPAHEPRLDDFEDYTTYSRALIRWEMKNELETQRAGQQREQQQRQQAETAEKWTAKLAEAKSRIEDYDEVVDSANVPEGPGKQAIYQALLESDKGADLAYGLAKDPATLGRLAGLSPNRVLIEIGKLEARLEEPARKEPAVSKAPAPIKPVGSRAATSTKKPEDMTPDEYIEAHYPDMFKKKR